MEVDGAQYVHYIAATSQRDDHALKLSRSDL
jgi:hypothetical protein